MGIYYDNGTWADRNISCGEPTYEYDNQESIIQGKTAQVDRRWAQRDGRTPFVPGGTRHHVARPDHERMRFLAE